MRYLSSLILCCVALGCTETLAPIEEVSSLAVTVVSPTDLGSDAERLADGEREVRFVVEALDTQGLRADLDADVDVYLHFLGGLTPSIGDPPLTTVALDSGLSAEVSIELASAFGQSFLWAEHASGDEPTYATGTSPSLWYRDAFLEDISRPDDEGALDALEASPLEGKQIDVNASRYGVDGRLIVTGIYAQGYTLSDVDCAGGVPCTVGDYDSIFVYTFSRPEDQEGRGLRDGQTVTRLTGAISEFNGLTEVNFPESHVTSTDYDRDLIPDPIVIQASWLTSLIELERAEASLVAIDGATLCPLDDDFNTYSQWKLDLGAGCDEPINIISAGQVPTFDPADYVGQVMPRVVGTLRPVNIGSFHVWIVYPRGDFDVQVP